MRSAVRLVVVACSFLIPVVLAAYHASERGDYEFGSRFNTVWLLVYGAIFLVATFIFGVPTLITRFRHALLASFLATTVPLAIASTLFVIYDPQIPRFIVVATPLVLFFIYLGCSVANVLITNRSRTTDLVMMVCAPAERQLIESSILGTREKQFTVVVMHSVDEFTALTDGELLGLVSEGLVNLIVLSEASQTNDDVVEKAANLHESGVRVRSLGAFYDEWLGKLPISELKRTGMWFDIKDLHEQFYARLKRLMDIVISLLIIPLFVVVVPLVFVLNRFGNRGPLFFSQDRVGHRGEIFRIHKFRTMVPQTGDDARGSWTVENDPRITKFGNVLRKTHLDELPQVVNVLVGDLAVVGPRPEQPHYVESLAHEIPFYGLRHAVRPGMTGWAQVKFPYGSTVEDAIQKLQYDLYYLRHQSIWLDMRVCVRTISSILFGQGR